MTNYKFGYLIIIAIAFFSPTQFSYGQKNELNINAYSGIFSFRGTGATTNSNIISIPYTTPGEYTSNPYGKKGKFSYALEIQGQRVTKNNNIYGLGISFETLSSKVSIDTVTLVGLLYSHSPVNGKTTLKNTFITFNPFIGHRYLYNKINFDLMAGIDLAFCLKSKESGKASTNSNDYTSVENDKTKPSIDFRPRIQVKAQIGKYGLAIGYSLGLTNYQTQTATKAKTTFLRLGINYQIK